jgi:AcrR family transcriptional regulator
MGRPAKHSADDFIDAAIDIFGESGVRAVTLNAVAEAVGAANGSVYHRFPDRPSLLAAVWLRTSKRFEAAYREKLGTPTIDSAIDAAVWVVQWCGEHPAAGQVLEAGARTFGPDDWPQAARDALSTDAELRREARRNVQALAASTAAPPEQIAFAMLDLPIAVARRSLQAGKAPAGRDAELVRSLATLILRQPPH